MDRLGQTVRSGIGVTQIPQSIAAAPGTLAIDVEGESPLEWGHCRSWIFLPDMEVSQIVIRFAKQRMRSYCALECSRRASDESAAARHPRS